MSYFLTPQRRAKALGIGSALVLAAGTALLAGCGAGTQASTVKVPHRTAPFETILEAQTELYNAPAPTVDLLKQLGVDEVKVFMPWNSLAPDPLSHSRPVFDATSPAAYAAGGWGPYDTIVREAAARGIGVDLALEAPAPIWAAGRDVPRGTTAGFLGAWKPSAHEFGRFVTAVGTRYSGHYTPPGGPSALPRVSSWSIWNEPTYGQQLAPQSVGHSTVEVSPAMYPRLPAPAWTAL